MRTHVHGPTALTMRKIAKRVEEKVTKVRRKMKEWQRYNGVKFTYICIYIHEFYQRYEF